MCHADTERVNFTQAFVDAGFYFSEVIIWAKNSSVFGRSDYHWKHEPILYGWKNGAAHKWYGDATKTTVWDHEPSDEEILAEAKRMIAKEASGASTVWSIKRPAKSPDHPTMKPVKLISDAIRNSSKRGDIILDVFGGSGSTMIAAEGLSRRAYLLELDQKYCDVIVRRWEKLTGAKAIKLTQRS